MVFKFNEVNILSILLYIIELSDAFCQPPVTSSQYHKCPAHISFIEFYEKVNILSQIVGEKVV